MIIDDTSRLLCKTEMIIDNGFPVAPKETNISEISILDLKPKTGMEYGFMFFDKESEENVCQIHFENKRRDYEVSYGTNEKYRGNGYMKEALMFFVKWIFENTTVEKMCALINNNPTSQHILESCGFVLEYHDEHGDWFSISRV